MRDFRDLLVHTIALVWTLLTYLDSNYTRRARPCNPVTDEERAWAALVRNGVPAAEARALVNLPPLR